MVRLEEKSTTRGTVAFDSPFLDELNVKAGDVVGFRDNMQYKITIDDVDYYRVRKEDLLYVEEEVYND